MLLMKKLFILLFIAGLLLSTGIYRWQSNQRAYLAGSDINAEQFTTLLEKDGIFYIYFYTDTCDQCLNAEPKLIDALKQVPVNLYKMDSVLYANIFASYQHQFNIPGVPAVLRFEQREVTGGRAGAPEHADVYVEFFLEKGDK